MKTEIHRWGNSLAVRIPHELATESRLSENAWVDLSIQDGQLVIRLIPESPNLEEYLGRVTPENCHSEWKTDPAVGKESW